MLEGLDRIDWSSVTHALDRPREPDYIHAAEQFGGVVRKLPSSTNPRQTT